MSFADVQYPGDEKLVSDNTGYHLECNQIKAAFKGRHWKEIPLELLRYHSEALFFFTPEAYRFYLPAYLIAGSLHYPDADRIPDSIVFSLLPPSDPQSIKIYGEIAETRLKCLTQAQRKAVKSFLQFVKQQHPEDEALGDVDKALASL